MTRHRALRPLPWLVLLLTLVLAACSSVAGTSPSVRSGAPSTSTLVGSSAELPDPSSSAPSTEVADPAAQILELHYLRSTMAGRQSEHTATVRGGGQVDVADDLDGTQYRFTLTQPELARLGELLPLLADAPEPTNGVSDVGRIDARFPMDGKEVTFSIEDWSMAGGTARLPHDERVVADAMIELRDLLIREPAGSTSGSAAGTGATPTS